MHKKYRISVNGRSYDVEVEEIADTNHNHTAHPHTAPAEATPVAAPVVAPPPPPSSPAAPAGAGAEVAPLAGVVDSIDVSIGQSISVGTKIATIEAMKMKTEVFSQHAGTVSSIAVKPQQSVDGGQVLLTLA